MCAAQRPAGARRLCPRGRSHRGGAPGHAGRSLPPSRTGRPHAATARRDRPRPGLPGGALIVDRIEGRAPILPDELGAMADTLVRIHSLPLPAAGSSIPRQENPFLETWRRSSRTPCASSTRPCPSRRACRDHRGASPDARHGAGRRQQAQPLTVALADTHPGNFIVDRDGRAWFVDLEKVHVGSPAIDLAHATLATSTLWHPDVGKVLSRTEVQGFYTLYLEKVGARQASAGALAAADASAYLASNHAVHGPLACADTRASRSRDPTQWSDAGLAPAMKAHIDARIDQCFQRETIQSIRAEWISMDGLTRS